MPAQVALVLCWLFIAWLMVRDAKRRPQLSQALWIPLIWVAIVGSRPLSLWFAHGLAADDDYHEGNSLDRTVFLALIIAGVVVLLRRRDRFQPFSANNKAVFFLYVFWAMSVLWADSSFVALKRWVKDIGNVVMVLVILSERDPIEAVKTLFARCTYLLIPLSVLCIKWYPGLGTGYGRWTGTPYYTGVTTNKNQLGVVLTVCTIFFVWEFLQRRDRKERISKLDIFSYFMLMVATLWLFRKANSATSLACTMFGVGALVALRLQVLKKRRQQLLPYALGGAVVMLAISSLFDLGAAGAEMLGRDPSLHGRTEIWSMALGEKSNPLLGAGFYSFWSPNRVEKFWQVYSFVLTQAHNGYLETYLNGGAIGLCLLGAMIIAAGRKIQKRLIADWEWGKIGLVFWITILAHNWSEASFNRLSLLWFVFLLVSIEYPRRRAEAPAVNQRIGGAREGDAFAQRPRFA